MPRIRDLSELLLLAAAIAALGPRAAAQDAMPRTTFAVAGHLRGDPHSGQPMAPAVPEFVAACAALRPDAVFLAGDLVWGDYDAAPTDRKRVEAEWEALDRALAPIGAPIHRVPGNHDINDLATRDLFFSRYGRLPRAERIGRCLVLLLASPWIPADGDQRKSPSAKGQALSPEQIAFLRRELGGDGFDHAFVVVHHVLWWDEEGSWWRAVHPVLLGTRVRAVFGGDFGPKKFSHLERDGIHYLQTCLETEPNPEILRIDEKSRVLSEPLDCWVYVEVTGAEVRYEVKTLGALTSPRHSPAAYRAVSELPPLEYLRYQVWDAPTRKRKIALGLVGLGFGAGAVATLLVVALVRRFRRRARG